MEVVAIFLLSQWPGFAWFIQGPEFPWLCVLTQWLRRQALESEHLSCFQQQLIKHPLYAGLVPGRADTHTCPCPNRDRHPTMHSSYIIIHCDTYHEAKDIGPMEENKREDADGLGVPARLLREGDIKTETWVAQWLKFWLR